MTTPPDPNKPVFPLLGLIAALTATPAPFTVTLCAVILLAAWRCFR